MLVFEYYAELLPNIKSISLLVFLSTPATVHTWTTIDPGSSFATLHHNGESAGLILPADVNPGLHQLVIRPRHGVRTLSSRFPLAVPLPIALTSDRNNAPWSASDLSSMASVSFCCRSCGAVLIPADQITHWKDLPSRNWADMMDFWHCHKPSHNVKVKPGESHKYSTFGKGFVLDPGTGLVDRSFFLFLNQDCEAAKVNDARIICSACRSLLGYPENHVEFDDSELFRLDKWNLSLNENETFQLECFLTSRLISYAEEGGVRRLLVSSQPQSTSPVDRFKIWIFNPDIRYTYTQCSKPIRGLKVLWQITNPEEDVPTGSFETIAFEAIVLDGNVFDTLKTCLDSTRKLFPGHIGNCGEWNVGVLRRFEEMS